MNELGIGSTVWLRRENTDREFERLVIGETARSWVVQHPHGSIKFPKKPDAKGEQWTGRFRGRRYEVFVSQEALESVRRREQEAQRDWRWLDENRYSISCQVRYCQDIAILRQIAALVGYAEKESE